MTPTWIPNLKLGDNLIPDQLWNETERYRKLPPMVEVLGLKKAPSDHGVMILVKFKHGGTTWLSVGWFTGVHE